MFGSLSYLSAASSAKVNFLKSHASANRLSSFSHIDRFDRLDPVGASLSSSANDCHNEARKRNVGMISDTSVRRGNGIGNERVVIERMNGTYQRNLCDSDGYLLPDIVAFRNEGH